MKSISLLLRSGLFGALLVFEISQSASGQSKNFVQDEIVNIPLVTQVDQLPGLTAGQKQMTKTYFDGMGRPIQVIAVKASPLQKDIIQPIAYGITNNQQLSYLPYVTSDGTSNFRANAISGEQLQFYNNGAGAKIANDSSPFSQQIIENSPLQRVLKTGSVGTGFQPGEHNSSINYRFNDAAIDGGVILWLPEGSRSGIYADNLLSVTEEIDGDGNKALIFTDKSGFKILKRQKLGAATNIDTYYIYNNAGAVSYAIPPKAVKLLIDNPAYTLSQASVAALIYKYVYDSKGRLAGKTTPGAGVQSIIYDPLDRPVLLQNANLKGSNKWNYIKYDVEGRAIIQGYYSDGTHITTADMQTYVDGMAATYNTLWYESRNTLAADGYYTSNVFPATGTAPLAYNYFDDYDLNYDASHIADYSYTAQGLTSEATATTFTRGMLTMTRSRSIGSGLANVWLTKVIFYDKRGNSIQVKNSNQLVNTISDVATSVPDFTGATLQTKVQKFHMSSISTTVLSTYSYDHMQRITAVKQKYNTDTETTLATYEYNEIGQLVKRKLGAVNNGLPVSANITLDGNNSIVSGATLTVRASNSITLNPGFVAASGAIFNAVIADSYLQNVDYRYNIRGQLLSINNSKLQIDATNNDDSNDVFGEELFYDRPNTQIGNTASYSGQLSAVKWMSKDGASSNSNERSHRYSYDALGRFTQSLYAERLSTAAATTNFTLNLGGFDEKGITYDESGNILSMQRNSSTVGGSAGTAIDNLTYTYDSNDLNKLLKVTDASSAAAGFRNYTGNTTNSYTYDGAGNVTADPYKGITLITYNVLNRVDRVTLSYPSPGTIGRYIDYTYEASGKLIRKQQYDGSVLQKTTDYIDGFIYTTAGAGTVQLDYFAMPEGRVRNAGTGGNITLKQEFVLTDHQGNARISFEDNGNGAAQVKQENSFYAFGMSMTSTMNPPTSPNKNLYNGGSEWQNDYSDQPDWQQTFYRNYDATIGRFLAVDPIAEASEGMTVYQYAGNNPIMMNDPLGDYVKPIPGAYYTTFFSGGLQQSMHTVTGNNLGTMDDYQLLQAAQNGNTDAYNLFVNRNKSTPNAAITSTLNYFLYGNIRGMGSLGEGGGPGNGSNLIGGPFPSINANKGGMTHDQELAKYGQIITAYNLSAGASLAQFGATVETGVIMTDKGWARAYKTVYYSPGFASPSGALGFSVVSPMSNKYLPTFSDWKGAMVGFSGSADFISGNVGFTSAYFVWGLGLSASPESLTIPAMNGVNGSGSMNLGATSWVGAPFQVGNLNLPGADRRYINTMQYQGGY
ncbi:RHS repeat-associated protein [Mucilaginibacter sp. UYNi724]